MGKCRTFAILSHNILPSPYPKEYYTHIITKKKLEDGDNIESLVNPNSKREELALGDANTRSLNKGEVLQLERKGYFIVDQPYISSKKPVILIYIPDGRSK